MIGVTITRIALLKFPLMLIDIQVNMNSLR